MTHTAVVHLGEIADLQAGVGFPPDLQGRTSGDYPVAKVGDISRVGRAGEAVINTADHFVDEIDLVRLKARPIPVGSVLFAKIGEAIRQNHRAIAGCELLVDNNAMAAIPTERVESRYLFHLLRTVDFYALASATTVPALRKSDLQRLPVPLPPLPEQRRIAAILDKADALRAKRRAALAQLDTLTQSIFHDMFGDPATNPKGWPVAPLAELCRAAGEYGAGVASKSYDSSLPRYIRITDITDRGQLTNDPVSPAGQPNEWESCSLDPGDILFARSGATVGKTYLHRESNGQCVFAGYLIRFRTLPDRLLPEFLFQFTRTAAYQSWVGARQRVVAQPNINAKQYGYELLVPCPPVELQERLTERLRFIGRIEATQSSAIAEADALFASLQHLAFQGEL